MFRITCASHPPKLFNTENGPLEREKARDTNPEKEFAGEKSMFESRGRGYAEIESSPAAASLRSSSVRGTGTLKRGWRRTLKIGATGSKETKRNLVFQAEKLSSGRPRPDHFGADLRRRRRRRRRQRRHHRATGRRERSDRRVHVVPSYRDVRVREREGERENLERDIL